MKTYANMYVLTVVLGVAMSGETARADFNNEQVFNSAEMVAEGAGTIDNAELRQLGVPRGERAFFLAGFTSIVRDSQRIADLTVQPDNQVEDDIEDLAENVKRIVRRLADRAEDIGLDNVDLNDGLDFINNEMNKILRDVD